MTPQQALEQGLNFHRAGRLAEAEAFYTRAIQSAAKGTPVLSQALISRGALQQQLGRANEAVVDFDRALALGPSSVAWFNRGLALIALSKAEEALTSFDMALALEPGAFQAHRQRGDVLCALRRFEEAIASFDRSLSLQPRDAQTMNNRAIALQMMGKTDAAIIEYGRALALEPNLPEALHARGNILWSLKQDLAPALTDLENLVRAAPDFPFAEGSLLHMEMTAARWQDFDSRLARLNAGVREGRPVVEPFIYLTLSESEADRLRCARIYSAGQFAPRPPLARTGARRPGRLRVGYVGGEFREHATLYLMVGLFEHHDKSNFEITVFDGGGRDESDLRARFEKAVEHIVAIGEMTDAEAAARIAHENIDILVDLNGYAGLTRANIFSYRPAPIQVAYLGYPGTSGAPHLDYVLADPVVIPPSDAGYYSEKIAWLPHSYQISDDKRAVAQTPSRAEVALPDNAFVFASFNNVNKLTPETFSLWMRILAATPGSVLWLLAPHAIAQENLKREAEARGVAAGRLIFAPALPFAEHLARLCLADLFLDGLPCGAHTTANDALWAGLPLLALRGKTFAGRVAASLLTAANLRELITENADDFEAEARRLAGDPAALKALRAKLAQTKEIAPLFDTVRTTRAIERALRMMAERQAPETFLVPDAW